MTAVQTTGRSDARGEGRSPGDSGDRAWDDGLIARRARPERPAHSPLTATALPPEHTAPPVSPLPPGPPRSAPSPVGHALRPRLDALRELVGLSGARLDRRTLAEARRVLEEAAARQRYSFDLTVVAIAGSTGSGKSTLFNALARAQLSEAGVRRPTTALPVSCAWSDRAEGLLDRLGIPARARRQPVRPYDRSLNGLVLLDLPDHDSAAAGHREQVDRLLRLVDAVIWVVDPEKYADAVLHERYLQPLAGYAEVTFVVLNQVDRLSRDAADQVLDDLRRLLDDDGLALGEHGEPGAVVMAISALTGEGIGELRELLGQFTARRTAAELRLTADVDGVSARLRQAYVTDGRPGLTEQARQEFEDRLAEAVGAQAAGLAAERAWRRDAERACTTMWRRARRWYRALIARVWLWLRALGPWLGFSGVDEDEIDGVGGIRDMSEFVPADDYDEGGVHDVDALDVSDPLGAEATVDAAGMPAAARRTASRPLVEQAVRTLAHEAATGLPGPWAQAVREAAVRGADGLADALDEATAVAASAPVVRRPGGWHTGGSWRAAGRLTKADEGGVWGISRGWRTGVGRAAAWRTRGGGAVRAARPRWWTVVAVGQVALLGLQLLGVAGLVGVLTGDFGVPWWVPGLLVAGAAAGGPALAWCCRVAARGPARRYGLEIERRLREAAAGCGRARVLEPVAAELLRYQEVRAQFVIAAGEV
ncbi:GTPase [Streptomyces sp. NPDC002536]